MDLAEMGCGDQVFQAPLIGLNPTYHFETADRLGAQGAQGLSKENT